MPDEAVLRIILQDSGSTQFTAAGPTTYSGPPQPTQKTAPSRSYKTTSGFDPYSEAAQLGAAENRRRIEDDLTKFKSQVGATPFGPQPPTAHQVAKQRAAEEDRLEDLIIAGIL